MGFLGALGFLTVLPVPARAAGPQALAAAPAYFPAVGLLIGLALAGLDRPLSAALPAGVVAALLLAAQLAMTGGLHLDGLADTCDGFFSSAGPERRLEIMRDSRVGGYGVAGAAVMLLLQYSAIAALPLGQRTVALVLAPVLGRWAMATALLGFPYARSQGMGIPFRGGGSPLPSLALATALALAACLALAGGPGAVLLAAVGVGTWLTARVLLLRLPGLTGDTYGAINEVVQAGVFVAFLLVA